MIQAKAQKLVEEALVWDNHACMPVRPGDTAFLDQLEAVQAIGVNLIVLNVSFDLLDWSHGFKMLATFRRWLADRQDRFILVETTADVLRAKRERKLAVCFDLEGGVAVDDTPELIEAYYALGVRWMLIAYNQNNRLGGGCQDEDTGLTPFGRRVIDEMERTGMVLCCTHTGQKTALEAMEYASKPVIFSHSNPSGVYNHPRNISDELIRACAETGGVVNINGIGLFLGENDNRSETIVRHIEYVADLVGVEHVGLGLDYVFDSSELDDYLAKNPHLFPPEHGYASGVRMVSHRQLPEIVQILMSRGWSRDDLLALLGRNNLRVAAAVWRAD